MTLFAFLLYCTVGEVDFWAHEWLRHGTCSSLDQLGYFLSVFHASAITDPAAALRHAGLLPSNLRPYTLQQVHANWD
jgi:ribonuclease T2